ncbi:hypothetical protein GQ596_10105 [Gilliamella sp. Pra-s60]|uniref:hypothetical protein n=1 Tax=Gilliamella sp. Pra-s60 TaxID=2687315 RepID=UPI0013262233|nr:hypothetical protein [Gilliamella sp. Pra-s60]MWN32796.1 hypothetical protein [Gilliamella sp. Pra-s60]
MCYHVNERQLATSNRTALEALFLNLIQYLGSQKQTPDLFSSSNPVESPNISMALSPRSRSLPFLSGLFKLSRWLKLPKSVLVFAPLLLLSYTQATQALTASTANTIEGSAPYLTYDGGQTRITTSDMLLSIKLPDGTIITPLTNTSTITDPIILPSGSSFNDIGMLLPPSRGSASLYDITRSSYHYWGDDDGDGDRYIGTGGELSAVFTDKNNRRVFRDHPLDMCLSPYKIVFSNTNAYLSTQFGIPNTTSFSEGSVEYYVRTESSIGVCSVSPSLEYGSYSYAGPANIWDPNKGFFLQSVSPSSYDLNFPTTGADGLYFDLDIGGFDASLLTWSPVTHSGITATVSRVKPNSGTFTTPDGRSKRADSWISDKSRYVTRVTLNGPKADSSQISASNPSPLSVPTLPQTFELQGKDSSGRVIVKYGFKLKQWFVNRGAEKAISSNQETWCSSLGYRIINIKDVTNAKCGIQRSWFPCVGDIDGATPLSNGDYFQRQIGAGFFSEWSEPSDYKTASFVEGPYWTNEAANSRDNFFVNSHGSSVFYGTASYYKKYGLCTTP